MNWGWETHRWSKSAKIVLGLATLWPAIYMVLFFVVIFSIVGLSFITEGVSDTNAENIDLIQLERKITAGEIRELRFTCCEILAVDRANKEFRTSVTSESTRAEILKTARELDASGRPRVEKIDENASQPGDRFLAFGVVGFFAAHMVTILLILGLMPLYIILVIKNDYLEQNIKIMWVILICMVNMFAMPFYWYFYIWRKTPPVATLPKPSQEIS